MDVSGKILLFILILSGFSAPRCGATTYHSNGSAANVQALQNAAQDGDTITLPAGAFIWTQGVTITKGITLQGQTTTDPVNRAANDRTIILDDLVRGPGGTPIIMVQSVLGKSYRLTGITFAPGSVATTNYNGAIKLLGTSQTVRVDDCHFNNLMYQAVNIMTAGSVYGVIDHNVLDFHGVSNNESVVFNNGGLNGDPAWANPGFYGSEKFMFVEDNCFNNTTNPFLEFAGCTDDTYGARWVFRYNHSYDAEIQTHGTECCRSRGGRAREVYNNDFHFSRTHGTIGIRSGGLITHDNTWDGAVPSQGGAAVQNYRSFFKFPGPWGGATGDNSWDYNATEPDGTHVDGHPPYVFLSGTATGGDGTHLIDTTKNWTTNQWVGYSVKRLSDGGFSYIQSNTSNTLTVFYYSDSGGSPIWTAGDQYQIHKLLIAMDQAGSGRGDLVSGDTPINTTTGTASWTHESLEPCYSWNNIYTPTNRSENIIFPVGNGPPIIIEGRDFYNNTVMPGYRPYVYPHPLVR